MARQRLEGIIEFSSPDKSWADNSAWPAPPLTSKPSHCSSAICCCSYLVRKEKQKLLAPIDHPTPATFQSFENNPMQLPVAQAQPCSSAARARALQQARLALHCLRRRLHFCRRRFRARWAVCPTEATLWVARPHLVNVRGTQTRFRRARGSIEATIYTSDTV